MKDSTPISDLKNFGSKSSKWLESIGIYTYGDLLEWDYIDIYKALKVEGWSVNIIILYAIYGAKNNCDWRQVPEGVKLDFAYKIKSL